MKPPKNVILLSHKKSACNSYVHNGVGLNWAIPAIGFVWAIHNRINTRRSEWRLKLLFDVTVLPTLKLGVLSRNEKRYWR
jgi:hypothetical protein